MFVSKSLRRTMAGLMLGAVAFAAVSCDDPTRILEIPDVRAIRLFMILDPDLSAQPILIQHISGEALLNLRGTVTQAANAIASAAAPGPRSDNEWYPCNERYGTLVNGPRCLVLDFRPQPGKTYDVAVSATDRSTARATTTVPGDFRIMSHHISGGPPGTTGVQATWTSSTGVFRYVVAIRGTTPMTCVGDARCHNRWFAATTDTTIMAAVSAEHFKGGGGPWFLDVYAMNHELYSHFMTGASGTFFPVPPAQNVRDGLGAVGAWVRRSVPVAP